MKYAYYPGCALHGGAKVYNDSTLAVAENLGIELQEIPNWNCCGASSAHSISHLLSLAIPGDTLVQAEEMGLDVVAPCAACYSRLRFAEHELKNNQEIKGQVEEIMDRKYQGTSTVLSTLEAIASVGADEIAKHVTKPLKGLKVASYYGCLNVKPPKVCHVDDPENPMIMDNIVKALGAEAVDWPFKTECCGGSQILQNKDAALKLCKDIIDVALNAEADIIVAACPLCQPNLDNREFQINKKFGTSYNVPVLYFTELMALAMGIPVDNWLKTHFVSPDQAFKKID